MGSRMSVKTSETIFEFLGRMLRPKDNRQQGSTARATNKRSIAGDAAFVRGSDCRSLLSVVFEPQHLPRLSKIVSEVLKLIHDPTITHGDS